MVKRKQKRGSGGSKSKAGGGGKRRGGAGGGSSKRRTHPEQDTAQYAKFGSLSNDFIQMQQMRDEREQRQLSKSKFDPKKLKKLNSNLPGYMEDLEDDGFGDVFANNSLFKKQKKMMKEARFTAKNRRNMMTSILRKIPIEFVKSKEVYNPSKLLEKEKEEEVDEEEEEEEEAETEKEINFANSDLDSIIIPDIDQPGDHDNESVHQSDFTDSSSEDDEEEIENMPSMTFSQTKSKPKRQMVFIDDNNSEQFEYSASDSASEEDDYDDDSAEEYEEPHFVPNDGESQSESDDEDDFQVGNLPVGKIKTDKLGNQYIDLPVTKGTKWFKETEEILYDIDNEKNDHEIDDVERIVDTKLTGISKRKIKKITDDQLATAGEIEFGYDELDYVSFDTTAIHVSNIRYGSHGIQYCIQAPMLLGMDDYQWLNKDDVAMFLTENGLPEKRVAAFLKYATKHLTQEQEEEEEEEEYIVYDERAQLDSDSEDEPEQIEVSSSSELDDELMEGIEDLLKMHQKAKQFGRTMSPLDVNTKSIKAKGKTTRDNFELEFNIDTPLDPQFKAHLEQMYIKRKENHSIKRDERNSGKEDYLLNKYPYCISMDDIVQEMKEFYKDPSLQFMRLPPLDFNAHMVVKDLCTQFQFACIKMGKGLKQHLQLRKSIDKKRRRHGELNWNKIEKLRKRRKLCFRCDVKLSKEEMRLFTRVSEGQREAWRSTNKPQVDSKGKPLFGYKEGQIVGANASEVPSDNIGRRLLEQMGWTVGEALGVEGNKGIVEPIKVIVKNSKKGIAHGDS